MLITIFVVSAAIVAFELILTFKFTIFKKINEHSWGAGFILSLFIGQVVGMMFGLTGAIVGMASIVAMVITDSFYAFKRRIVKGDPQASTFHQTVRFWSKTFKVVSLAFKILTAPIWLPGKILAWIESHKPAPKAPAANVIPIDFAGAAA